MPDIHCIMEVKAVPNAARSEVVGWMGDALKIKLKAPPVDGRTNQEMCRYLADTLGLPKGSVTLRTGASSRQKRVQIDGISAEAVRGGFPR